MGQNLDINQTIKNETQGLWLGTSFLVALIMLPMSRSYRKPWLKDNGGKSGIPMKTIHARRYRRICKVLTKKNAKDRVNEVVIDSNEWGYPELYYLEPEYPHRWSVSDPYDLCDWRWFVRRGIYRGDGREVWTAKDVKFYSRK